MQLKYFPTEKAFITGHLFIIRNVRRLWKQMKAIETELKGYASKYNIPYIEKTSIERTSTVEKINKVSDLFITLVSISTKSCYKLKIYY